MQIEPNATSGTRRQVNNSQINTAEIVNAAIVTANESSLDLTAAETYLRHLGHAEPADELIEQVAYQSAVLAEIERLTGANVSGQTGKWNFTNAATVLASFESYLNRRIDGQHAKHTARYGRR
jgi:hypothetical protein